MCVSYYHVSIAHQRTINREAKMGARAQLELVPVTHKPKRKAHTYMDSDSDVDYKAEANADAIVTPRKADKGKAKAVDLPEDLYGSPVLRVCSNFLTL